MSRPKRQRTVYPTIKDRQTDVAMFPAVKVERSRVTVSNLILVGYDRVTDEQMTEAMGRMVERAGRLGRLLQARWFGTGTP